MDYDEHKFEWTNLSYVYDPTLRKSYYNKEIITPIDEKIDAAMKSFYEKLFCSGYKEDAN